MVSQIFQTEVSAGKYEGENQKPEPTVAIATAVTSAVTSAAAARARTVVIVTTRIAHYVKPPIMHGKVKFSVYASRVFVYIK